MNTTARCDMPKKSAAAKFKDVSPFKLAEKLRKAGKRGFAEAVLESHHIMETNFWREVNEFSKARPNFVPKEPTIQEEEPWLVCTSTLVEGDSVDGDGPAGTGGYIVAEKLKKREQKAKQN